MEIYTIEHSNYEIEILFDMLIKFNIYCVVDIRGILYSRYNIQFNKNVIQYSLIRAGFKYGVKRLKNGCKKNIKLLCLVPCRIL